MENNMTTELLRRKRLARMNFRKFADENFITKDVRVERVLDSKGTVSDIRDFSASVQWRMDIDYRAWGIDGMYPVISSVFGWLEVDTTPWEEEESISMIDFKYGGGGDNSWNIEAVDYEHLEISKTLSPQAVFIDMQKKKIEVSFGA